MKTASGSLSINSIPPALAHSIVVWRNSAKLRHADVNKDEHNRKQKIRAYKSVKEDIRNAYRKYSGIVQEDYLYACRMRNHALSNKDALFCVGMMRQTRLTHGNFLSFLIEKECGEFHDRSIKFRPLSHTCPKDLEDWTSVIIKKRSVFFDTLRVVLPSTFNNVWTADIDEKGSNETVFYFSDKQDAMMFKLRFG